MRAKFVSIRTFGLALLVAVSTIILCGCSVIGAGIGAYTGRTSPSLEVENVKPGTHITIITNKGSKISGKYVGLDFVPTVEYAESYAKSRKQNREKVILPTLGDSVTITPYSGLFNPRRELEGKFLGFDLGAILVRRTGRTEPSKVFLKTIINIVDSNGNVVRAETLRKLMSEGRIPLLSVVYGYVSSEGKTTRFAMDGVHQIQVPVRIRRVMTGFLIGASVDILFAWWIFTVEL